MKGFIAIGMSRTFFCLVVSVIGFAISAHASPITLNATHSGWYAMDDSTGNPNASDNYIVGRDGYAAEVLYRNFFVFDLSSIDLSGFAVGDVSANLLLYNTVGQFLYGGMETPDAEETYEVYGISSLSLINDLENNNSYPGIYSDLVSGSAYGSVTVNSTTPDPNPSTIVVPLNNTAIASLIASSGTKWAVGGDLTTLGIVPIGTDPYYEYMFGYTGQDQWDEGVWQASWRQLEINVIPEPTSLLLLGTGLGILWLGVYQRRKG